MVKTKFKKLKIPMAGSDMEQEELTLISGGIQNGRATLAKYLAIS